MKLYTESQMIDALKWAGWKGYDACKRYLETVTGQAPVVPSEMEIAKWVSSSIGHLLTMYDTVTPGDLFVVRCIHNYLLTIGNREVDHVVDSNKNINLHLILNEFSQKVRASTTIDEVRALIDSAESVIANGYLEQPPIQAVQGDGLVSKEAIRRAFSEAMKETGVRTIEKYWKALDAIYALQLNTPPTQAHHDMMMKDERDD